MKHTWTITLLGLAMIATVVFGASDYNIWKSSDKITLTTSATANASTTKVLNIGGGAVGGAQSIEAKFMIFKSDMDSTKRGFGLSDTVIISLVTQTENLSKVLKADTCKGTAGLPCSCYYAMNRLIGDTLLKQFVGWTVRVADTLSDSVLTAHYKYREWIQVK